MEKKNFLGLDGLSNFWSKAKTWIINRITAEVTVKIAEIVANAPEDLDTLKEIADWISTHEDSASAMNTAILANTEAINGKADKSHTHTKSEITDFAHTHDDRYYTESEGDTKLSGKADKSHTHTKSEITDFPTSLPANGGTATAVSDCGNTAKTIKIGYSGEDLTSCRYLAAYNNDGSQIRSIPLSSVSVGNADNATYAASAGNANSVAWGNVTGKPAYITGSYSNGILNLYTN